MTQPRRETTPSTMTRTADRRAFLRACALSAATIASCGAFGADAGVDAAAPATGAGASPMLTRTIPRDGRAIPAVGLGTYQAFDPPDLEGKSLDPLQEVLRIFYDHGGRVIDTAPSYGRAEEVTGLLTEKMGINADVFLATKVAERGEAAGVRSLERSFQRLRRKDAVELMQVHNLVDLPVQWKTLRAWKDQGKFRYVGITHYLASGHDALERAMKAEKPDFIQVNYSVAERESEKSLLPTARDLGVAVLINRPFGGGNLFGQVRGKPLPESAKGYAASWGQAFLKFILANEAIAAVIPATSNPKHMADNIQAGFGQLPTPEEREELVNALSS